MKIKKQYLIFLILTCILLASLTSIQAWEQPSTGKYDNYVIVEEDLEDSQIDFIINIIEEDGKSNRVDNILDYEIKLVRGRTSIAVKDLEKINTSLSISWGQEDHTANVLDTSTNETIIFPINRRIVDNKGNISNIDTAATVDNRSNRTYIPFRALMEELGYKVDYEHANKLITAKKINKEEEASSRKTGMLPYNPPADWFEKDSNVLIKDKLDEKLEYLPYKYFEEAKNPSYLDEGIILKDTGMTVGEYFDKNNISFPKNSNIDRGLDLYKTSKPLPVGTVTNPYLMAEDSSSTNFSGEIYYRNYIKDVVDKNNYLGIIEDGVWNIAPIKDIYGEADYKVREVLILNLDQNNFVLSELENPITFYKK